MKCQLLALGVLLLISSIALAQSKAEEDLYEALSMKGPKSVAALDSVLKESDQHSALILFVSAIVALSENRLEDSGFLFYIAQLRTRFDKECFLAKGEGGDSPFVLLGAMSQQIGTGLNPAIMAEPKVYAKAIARVKAWSPKAGKDYDPGYEFLERKTEEEALKATKASREEYVKGMSEVSTLLDDAVYFAAFRVVQAYNLSTDDKRPTKAESDAATETMKQIEKENGLKGFFPQ